MICSVSTCPSERMFKGNPFYSRYGPLRILFSFLTCPILLETCRFVSKAFEQAVEDHFCETPILSFSEREGGSKLFSREYTPLGYLYGIWVENVWKFCYDEGNTANALRLKEGRFISKNSFFKLLEYQQPFLKVPVRWVENYLKDREHIWKKKIMYCPLSDPEMFGISEETDFYEEISNLQVYKANDFRVDLFNFLNRTLVQEGVLDSFEEDVQFVDYIQSKIKGVEDTSWQYFFYFIFHTMSENLSASRSNITLLDEWSDRDKESIHQYRKKNSTKEDLERWKLFDEICEERRRILIEDERKKDEELDSIRKGYTRKLMGWHESRKLSSGTPTKVEIREKILEVWSSYPFYEVRFRKVVPENREISGGLRLAWENGVGICRVKKIIS